MKPKPIKAYAIYDEAEGMIYPSSTDETPPALEIYLKKTDALVKKQKGETIIEILITPLKSNNNKKK